MALARLLQPVDEATAHCNGICLVRRLLAHMLPAIPCHNVSRTQIDGSEHTVPGLWNRRLAIDNRTLAVSMDPDGVRIGNGKHVAARKRAKRALSLSAASAVLPLPFAVLCAGCTRAFYRHLDLVLPGAVAS